MKYMGSKNRIAKNILPIILKDRKDGQWYVEPFVGGANIIDKVEGNRIGSDFNEYLIRALKFTIDNLSEMPSNNKEYKESDYELAKSKSLGELTDFDCLMLHVCSFSGIFKSNFARGRVNEDFVRAAKGNATKQVPLIKGVDLIYSNYSELEVPPQSIIYCDPPYRGTAKYKVTGNFDHDKFFDWCRGKVKEGHKVFISEYNAPSDFVCVWQKEIQSGLNTNSTKKGIEKLFVHESQLQVSFL